MNTEKYIKKLEKKILDKLNKTSLSDDELHDLFYLYDKLDYFKYHQARLLNKGEDTDE